MALTLPAHLVKAAHYLGYEFPRTNEDVLHQWATHLKNMDHGVDCAHQDLLAAIRHVQSHNQGAGVDAFTQFTTSSTSDSDALTHFYAACEIAAKGCDICAYIVVMVKSVTIAQLALIAPALLAGPVSFLLKKGVEYAINTAIAYAIAKILE